MSQVRVLLAHPMAKIKKVGHPTIIRAFVEGRKIMYCARHDVLWAIGRYVAHGDGPDWTLGVRANVHECIEIEDAWDGCLPQYVTQYGEKDAGEDDEESRSLHNGSDWGFIIPKEVELPTWTIENEIGAMKLVGRHGWQEVEYDHEKEKWIEKSV